MAARVAFLHFVLIASSFAVRGQTRIPLVAQKAASVPQECDKPELLSKGRPIMTTWRNGLALGISLAQQKFKVGEPITLYVWIDNSGDTETGVMTCDDLGHFKAKGFDIFAANQHPVQSRGLTRIKGKCVTDPLTAQGMSLVLLCGRNFPIKIPAHTCSNGDSFDLTTVLTDNYDLPPGDYTIRLRQGANRDRDACEPDEKVSIPASHLPVLIFSVEKP